MATVTRFGLQDPPNLSTCGSALSCGEAFLVSVLCLLAWLGLSSFLLFSPRTNVQGALGALRTERERVVAEADAFESFAKAVRKLTPGSPTTESVSRAIPAGGPASGGMQAASDGGLAAVQEAYQDTVMAVDHYEEDYGESLPRNIATEFGDDLAIAVTNADALTPALQDALASSAADARQRRRRYLVTLDEEADRLAAAETTLTDIHGSVERLDVRGIRQRPFEDIRGRWERLAERRTELEQFLVDQQETVQDGLTIGGADARSNDFYAHLYDGLGTQYPAITDGVRLADRIADLDHRLTRALAGRP